ncbi:LAETG motif-containing sortase-dependent surface protein [Streptomyces sp. L2]|uniref:LAETG motif-containing sortase-dependent surface protein n=1 Tax=Streptomyces sp. L2 TaxID=2162665 RepID=UPI0019D6DB00|nr:LAETG motif-containing sortase-dependent surface protein [Streptomyces sp. L2]
MSMTRRSAHRSVRILGVASASAALALGIAGQASACVIGDFTAEAKCDGAKGAILVTDKDASATPATITLFRTNKGGVEKQIDEKADVKGSAKGTVVTFAENWQPTASYRIHVQAGAVDQDISPALTLPSKACAPESPSPSPSTSADTSPSPKPSKSTPAESDTPTPSTSESSAPAVPSDNAPSPAAGDSNLAETGANSNTGLIAGIAGALVVLGGIAVFFGLRRRSAGNGR